MIDRRAKYRQHRLKSHTEELEDPLVWLGKQISRLDDAWKTKDDLLRGISGVGTVTILELGRLNRQEIAKLLGVAPLADDSGKHWGKRFVRGRPGRGASSAVHGCDQRHSVQPGHKTFANSFAQAGKPAKVVITACMRKLLTIMNAICQLAKTALFCTRSFLFIY